MTNMIVKHSFESAFTRPVFLILLVIALLMAPASAFASDDNSIVEDSSQTADQTEPTDQFESQTVFEQDATANSGDIDTDLPEVAPPEIEDSNGIDEIPALETPSPSQPDEQSEPAENTGVGNSYIATITPDAVAVSGTDPNNQIPLDYQGLEGGDNGTFTVTFTEIGSNEIAAAMVEIPSGFSNVIFNNGWSDNNILTSGNQSWEGKLVDGMFIYLQAAGAGSYLTKGEWVSVTFNTKTPTVIDNHRFKTQAWTASGVPADFGEVNFGFTDPVGNNVRVADDPVVIVGLSVSTADDLNNVRNNSSDFYVQTADIDLDVAPYKDDEGWSPIGTYDDPFTGTYDGDVFKISNLYINRPVEDHIGLFGYTGNGAVLRNINLETVNITGDDVVGGLVGRNYGTIKNSSASGTVKGDEYVGGLVGRNYGTGTIENSFAEGAVSGTYYVETDYVNADYVGGLVGGNTGTISMSYSTGTVTGYQRVGGLVGENRGTIEKSYAAGDVGGKNDVGGLVGGNSSTGKIENSYATGDVEGKYDVGGLVGDNSGTIKNSYAAGDVDGNENVGGLVGVNGFEDKGIIENSYAAGAVTGSTYVGGLVGGNSVTIKNSYWNVAFSPGVKYNSGTVDDASSEKTTADLQTLDFHQTTLLWDIAGKDGSYPVLGWQVGKSTIWYMITPPVDNGTGSGDFVFYDFDFANELLTQLSTSLTTVTGQSNAVITPGIIAYGSWNDFYQASVAYQVALEYLEKNRTTLSPVELALLEIELAITRAAILAMEARLLAAEDLPYNLAAFQTAYAAAVASLNAHQSSLSAGQLAAANQLLAAIAGVIAALQQMNA